MYIVDVKGKGTEMLFTFERVPRAKAINLLIEGYEYLYLDVAQGEFTDEFLNSDVSDWWSVYADVDEEFTPGIYSDGERLDALVEENYFEQYVYIRINGRPNKMSREMYNDYLYWVEIENRDAEHDARGTASNVARIYSSY